MLSMVVRRVGFFHFVRDFNTPIEALTKEIEKERDKLINRAISESLIVLPEAFNIGRDYETGPPELSACKILDELRKLARLNGIAFVAGILEGKCNSAYWIDATGRQLMCHKMADDLKDIYDPCTECCDEQNPIDCGNARVGTLICMDATDEKGDIKRRRNALLARLREADSAKIVCVPARFYRTTPGPSGAFSGCWHIVADGVYCSRSLVADTSGNIQVEANGQNEVKTCPLTVNTLSVSG
jgi:predicted amidohydrolase